jgi:hypothetical protein
MGDRLKAIGDIRPQTASQRANASTRSMNEF